MKRLIVAALFPVAAIGQPLDSGTYDVYNQDITAEGNLEGCSLVFTAVTQDTAYRHGAPIVLNGSISLRTLGRMDLLLAGKLGTRQWSASGPTKWERPVHFHFFTKNGTTAGHAQVTDGENDGYRLLLGRAMEGPILGLVNDMANDGRFSVGFNRKPGGQDVTADIDITAKITKDENGVTRRTHTNEASIAYSSCVSRLLTDLQHRLGGK